MKRFLPITILIIALIAGYFFLNRKAESNPFTSIKEVIATPTPVSFVELTIPYLRERSYTSTLGERTLFENNGSYDSYLTSYDSDGLKINGLLTIPTGEEPENGWPAIVFIHGYIPPAQYQTTEKYTDYVNYLARNGFVVFKIDLRGHGDSEGTPGGAYYSSDYVIDTLNAYAALRNTDFVDPESIGLWGHSMAGNVILRSMAARPDIPAAVIWAGAVYTYEDMRRYGISDSSYVPPPSGSPTRQTRRRIFEKVGEFSPDNEFWKQVAATNYLDDIKGSLQIHHAVNDDVVSIEYSRNLLKVAEGTGFSVEVIEHPSGGHNISDPGFSEAMQETVTFFSEHLR
ncbi:alpha/beta fold hydrolase [Candidatus Roizmanbacteria bacterium]|nr:MAG: alpha/beta fold hydrolase [Candidatus Roizmanbacteria bacterium]